MPPVTAPILPGAEPFSRTGGPSGVLVLHGFTGNPQSLRPLAEALAGAGYTVDLPLLPGHGTAVEDMIPTRWSDWSGAAESAYAGLAASCQAVAVAALSMGGTLACRLAEHHPEIRGLALVNPFIDPPAESFREVLRGALESGTDLAPGVGSDIKRDGVAELAYPGTPIAAALELLRGDRRHRRRSGAHHLSRPAAVESQRPRRPVLAPGTSSSPAWPAPSSGSGWRTAITWPPSTTTPTR